MAKLSSSNGIEKFPKLRFPEFIEQWELFRVDEIFDNVAEKNHANNKVLTIIQGKGTLPREEAGRNINYDNKSLSNYKQVKKGDFIIHLRSFEGGLEMANELGIVSPAYTILRNKKTISNGFYREYFHTDEFINHILAKSVEGIRDGRQINYNTFKLLKIPYCNIAEQEKISRLFSILNKRIEKQKQLVNAIKKYKRGLLRDVFSRKIRLTKSDDEWKNQHIGDILHILHGRDYKEFKNPNGKYPVLGTSGIIDYSNKFLCNWSCVLIGRKGTIDRPQYMDTPFWTVDTLFYTKPKNGQDPKFQYYLFQTINWKKYNEASGVPSLSSSTIASIPISMPKIEVQNKIAKFFTLFDKKICMCESELKSLIKIKKALLQQLFI